MVITGFLAGMAWGPMGPLLNTLVQTRLPASVHGRVFGAQMALFSAGPPLGMVVAGALVDGFGVFVVYPALVGLVLALAIGLSLHPALRDLGRAS
jgi:MFS family permease